MLERVSALLSSCPRFFEAFTKAHAVPIFVLQQCICIWRSGCASSTLGTARQIMLDGGTALARRTPRRLAAAAAAMTPPPQARARWTARAGAADADVAEAGTGGATSLGFTVFASCFGCWTWTPPPTPSPLRRRTAATASQSGGGFGGFGGIDAEQSSVVRGAVMHLPTLNTPAARTRMHLLT